ncbi:hypothetical protein ACFQ0B_70075 [Nonomuraea thailandensis]
MGEWWRRRRPAPVEYIEQPAVSSVRERLPERPAGGEVLLSLRGVSKRFGGLVAVDDVSSMCGRARSRR